MSIYLCDTCGYTSIHGDPSHECDIRKPYNSYYNDRKRICKTCPFNESGSCKFLKSDDGNNKIKSATKKPGSFCEKGFWLKTQDVCGKCGKVNINLKGVTNCDECGNVFTERQERVVKKFYRDVDIDFNNMDMNEKRKRLRNRLPYKSNYNNLKYEWISTQKYIKDIYATVPKIPKDIDVIVGVSRSGLFPASLLSMHLHLPFFVLRTGGFLDLMPCEAGWRFNGRNYFKKTDRQIHISDFKHPLVVDDNSQSGTSNKITRSVMDKNCEKYTLLNIYVKYGSSCYPDIFHKNVDWPSTLMEWNIFNSINVNSGTMAFDFDGILCEDCLPHQDDDGEKYLDFINNAKPKYIIRKKPIPLIVTARIEKYREPTMKWLDRHGMRVDKLVMHPARTLAERRGDNIAAYKARHFKEFADNKRRGIFRPTFFESCNRQANEIARITNEMVVCPPSEKIYIYKKEEHYPLDKNGYFDFLKGKKVALVCPSPYLDEYNYAEEINQADIVVGINGAIAPAALANPNLGRKPDVVYHNSLAFFDNESGMPGTTDDTYSENWWRSIGIPWVMLFLPAPHLRQATNAMSKTINRSGSKCHIIDAIQETKKFLEISVQYEQTKALTAGLAATCLLLNTPCDEVKVYGLFHPGHTKLVADGYGQLGNYKVYRGNKDGDMTKISVGTKENIHDLREENHILYRLYKKFYPRLKLDSYCGHLIEEDIEKFKAVRNEN